MSKKKEDSNNRSHAKYLLKMQKSKKGNRNCDK